jgi:hypothetical protein
MLEPEVYKCSGFVFADGVTDERADVVISWGVIIISMDILMHLLYLRKLVRMHKLHSGAAY